jgi:hypothetical protein
MFSFRLLTGLHGAPEKLLASSTRSHGGPVQESGGRHEAGHGAGEAVQVQRQVFKQVSVASSHEVKI